MNILYYDLKALRTPQIEDSEESDEENFISISKQTKTTRGMMMDIYVSLLGDHSHRLLISIPLTDNFNTLLGRVSESLSRKYDMLRGLQGLRVKQIKMLVTQTGKRATIHIGQVITINPNPQQQEKLVQDYFKKDEHIIVEIDSLDIWLSISLYIHSPFKNLGAELSLKVDKNMASLDLCAIIQKLCLRIWNQFCLDNKEARQHLFVLTALKIQNYETVDELQSGEDITNINITNSYVKNSHSKLVDLQVNRIIAELFTYKNNQVSVNCDFETVEQIYLMQHPPLEVMQSNASLNTDNALKLVRKHQIQPFSENNPAKVSYRLTQQVKKNRRQNVRTVQSDFDVATSLPQEPLVNNHCTLGGILDTNSDDSPESGHILGLEQVELLSQGQRQSRKTSAGSFAKSGSRDEENYQFNQQNPNIKLGNLVVPRFGITTQLRDEDLSRISRSHSKTVNNLAQYNPQLNLMPQSVPVQGTSNLFQQIRTLEDQKEEESNTRLPMISQKINESQDYDQNFDIDEEAPLHRNQLDLMSETNEIIPSSSEPSQFAFSDEEHQNKDFTERESLSAVPFSYSEMKKPLLGQLDYQNSNRQLSGQHDFIGFNKGYDNMYESRVGQEQNTSNVGIDNLWGSTVVENPKNRKADYKNIGDQEFRADNLGSKGTSIKRNKGFIDLINRIRRNQKTNYPSKKQRLQEASEIPEQLLIQKITLPTFLLAKEEYNSIKVPVMKNFIYKEKEFEDSEQVAGESRMMDKSIKKQKTKKFAILFACLIILVMAFVLLIVFLVVK